MSRTLKLIFASLSIYSFSTALVSVFVPIFLIQRGFSLAKIIFIFFLYALSKLVINYPTVRFIVKRGSRAGLIFSYGLSMSSLILLNIGLIQLSYWLIVLAFIIAAGSDALQWNAQHLHLSSLLDRARKSGFIALFSNITVALGVVGPLIGGLVAGYYGATMLLLLTALCGAAAILPLYGRGFEQHEQLPADIPYNLKGAPVKDMVANAAWNTEAAIAAYIWPMYVLLFIGELQQIGLLVAIGSLLTFAVVYIAGRRGDRQHAKLVVTEGSVLAGCFHLLRALAQTTPLVILGDLGYKVAHKYLEIGWVSTYYGHAKGRGIGYINSMEIAGDAARVVMWALLWLVAFGSPSSSFYKITFVLAGVITLVTTFISREKPAYEAN